MQFVWDMNCYHCGTQCSERAPWMECQLWGDYIWLVRVLIVLEPVRLLQLFTFKSRDIFIDSLIERFFPIFCNLKEVPKIYYAYVVNKVSQRFYILIFIQTIVGWVSKGQEHICNGGPVFVRYVWMKYLLVTEWVRWPVAGNSLLVKPVTEQHATSLSVYMPGMNAVSNMWCALFRILLIVLQSTRELFIV